MLLERSMCESISTSSSEDRDAVKEIAKQALNVKTFGRIRRDIVDRVVETLAYAKDSMRLPMLCGGHTS
jgi:ATP-dependent protease Clp ATPase subunit